MYLQLIAMKIKSTRIVWESYVSVSQSHSESSNKLPQIFPFKFLGRGHTVQTYHIDILKESLYLVFSYHWESIDKLFFVLLLMSERLMIVVDQNILKKISRDSCSLVDEFSIMLHRLVSCSAVTNLYFYIIGFLKIIISCHFEMHYRSETVLFSKQYWYICIKYQEL